MSARIVHGDPTRPDRSDVVRKSPQREQPPPRRMIAGEVERRTWDTAAALDAIKSGRPVVLTGCPLHQRVVGRWTFSHLARAFDGSEKLNIHLAPANESASSFERVYATGLNASQDCDVKGTSFREFFKDLLPELLPPRDGTRPPVRRYLSAPLLRARPASSAVSSSGGAPPSALRPALRDSFQCCHSGDIKEDLQSLVDWDWLEEVQGHLFATGAGSFNSCHMWAGAGGGSTPVHFDALSNFLAQVSGTKRVLLFPPSESFKLYPYPVSHPKTTYAMVDLRGYGAADGGAAAQAGGGEVTFSALSRARGVEARLEPGDCLFLPRYWWHFVSSPEAGKENLSINFWFSEVEGAATFKAELTELLAQQEPIVPPETVEAAAAASAASAATAAAAAPVVTSSQCRPSLDADEIDDALLGAGPVRDEPKAERCLLASRYVEGLAASNLGAKGGADLLMAMARGEDHAAAGWTAESERKRLATRIRGLLIVLLGGADTANALLRAMARDGRLAIRMTYSRVRGSR